MSMLLKPEKILVFSSESDDSIGLQIYRLIYKEFNRDLIFLEGEYKSTREIDNYPLPAENGEDVYLGVDELIQFFEEVEDTQVIVYPNIGIFYDYGELGFEFTDDMIEEIVSNIDPEEVRPDVRSHLEDFSYISQNWAILDWEESKARLLDNLDVVVNSVEDVNKIEAVILESAEFQNAAYPALFEMLLYAADQYEEKNLFARTKSKVFCLKTTAKSKYQNFIYDIGEIEIPKGKDTKIVDLDIMLLNEWFDEFTLGPEDIEDAEDITVDLEQLRRDEETKRIEEELMLGYDDEDFEEETIEMIPDTEEEDEIEDDEDLEEDFDEPLKEPDEEEKNVGNADLTNIKGIGASTAEVLQAEGYRTVQSIADATVEELSALKGIGKATAQKYINNAKSLL